MSLFTVVQSKLQLVSPTQIKLPDTTVAWGQLNTVDTLWLYVFL